MLLTLLSAMSITMLAMPAQASHDDDDDGKRSNCKSSVLERRRRRLRCTGFVTALRFNSCDLTPPARLGINPVTGFQQSTPN